VGKTVPRYYFDEYDGETVTQDDEGLELNGIEAARAEARKALPDIARDVLPEDGDRRTMVVKVRDEAGKVVITATLSLLIETAP
jgi:hypothetical protein